MKKYQIIILLLLAQIAFGQQLDKGYFTWDDFANGFDKEIVSAEDVYDHMVKSGLKQHSLATIDFQFISDKKENLTSLKQFLISHYPYGFKKIKQLKNGLWELNGITNDIPITEDNLLYWALEMYKRGYENDAKLDGYGALIDHNNPEFPNLEQAQEDYYFDKGVECYESGDLSGAIINWSLVLEINPNDPNSYYSRAIVKNELFIWESALRDYDKAIELAPDFINALTNRGSLKDENGDYNGAIEDYNKVIAMPDVDTENKQMCYYNRGNSKFNLGDKIAACKDWRVALDLGAVYALERINKECEK